MKGEDYFYSINRYQYRYRCQRSGYRCRIRNRNSFFLFGGTVVPVALPPFLLPISPRVPYEAPPPASSWAERIPPAAGFLSSLWPLSVVDFSRDDYNGRSYISSFGIAAIKWRWHIRLKRLSRVGMPVSQ